MSFELTILADDLLLDGGTDDVVLDELLHLLTGIAREKRGNYLLSSP